MEAMTSTASLPMRDPQGNLEAYAARLRSNIPDRAALEKALPFLPFENRMFRLGHQLSYDQDYLCFRHGLGFLSMSCATKPCRAGAPC